MYHNRIQTAKERIGRGILPNYLVKYKIDAEKERRKTLEEIELNKRPMGTERLRKEEVVKVRNKLRDKKARLRSAIT